MDDPTKKKARGGRPRALEPRSSVCTWIPASQHDRLIRIANAREQSVSRLIGDILTRALTPRS